MTHLPAPAPGEPEQGGAGSPTAPRQPGGHLDLDALADALVGELADDAHLQRCADCTARLDELRAAEADLGASLAGLVAPQLPDAVAARWQDALRAAGDSGTGRAASSARVVPLRRPRRTWPASVAASLVLVLAGGWGWSALQDGGGADSDTAATAASGGAERSADRAEDTGAGASTEQEGDDSARSVPPESVPPDTAAALAAPVPRSATGLDYADPAQRAAAVAQVLADRAAGTVPRPGAGAPPAPSGTPVDALARLREPEALAGCLSALGAPAVAVDDARFGAEPALAVLQESADPGLLVLTVVGAGCSPADPAVLLTTSVPRPR